MPSVAGSSGARLTEGGGYGSGRVRGVARAGEVGEVNRS